MFRSDKGDSNLPANLMLSKVLPYIDLLFYVFLSFQWTNPVLPCVAVDDDERSPVSSQRCCKEPQDIKICERALLECSLQCSHNYLDDFTEASRSPSDLYLAPL